MASINQKEKLVLKFLAEELTRHGHPVTASTVAKSMVPKSNAREAQICLRHLEKSHFVTSNFDNPKASGYQITRDGLVAVEAMDSCEVRSQLTSANEGSGKQGLNELSQSVSENSLSRPSDSKPAQTRDSLGKGGQKTLNRLAALLGVSRFVLNLLVALAAIATIGGFLILLDEKGWL